MLPYYFLSVNKGTTKLQMSVVQELCKINVLVKVLYLKSMKRSTRFLIIANNINKLIYGTCVAGFINDLLFSVDINKIRRQFALLCSIIDPDRIPANSL